MQVQRIIKFFISVSVPVFLLTGLSACYYDSVEELYPRVECDTTALTYTEDIKPLIDNSCAISGCHISSGGNGIPLEDYNQVYARVQSGALYERVIVRKDMPPGQPLNECQQAKITAWINAGAPR